MLAFAYIYSSHVSPCLISALVVAVVEALQPMSDLGVQGALSSLTSFINCVLQFWNLCSDALSSWTESAQLFRGFPSGLHPFVFPSITLLGIRWARLIHCSFWSVIFLAASGSGVSYNSWLYLVRHWFSYFTFKWNIVILVAGGSGLPMLLEFLSQALPCTVHFDQNCRMPTWNQGLFDGRRGWIPNIFLASVWP